MQLDCEITAARRRASRLAGLVRLPAVWPIQTAIRQQASWLAAKASMILTSRWPFALRKNTSYAKAPHPAGVEYVPRQLRRSRAAIGSGGKKARPFCRRKKGEHERAPPLCVSYPAPLRATLRAPPSKWAIGAFFPESPCRMLSLVLSFAPKESTTPLGAAAPSSAPQSARQAPSAKVVRLRAHQRAFLRANNRRGSHCRALRLLFA